jgi:hypothetical protein
MKNVLIAAVIFLLIGFFLSKMIFPEKTSPEIRYVEKISRDTIEIVRQAEPLVITRTKVKIRELRDTIILEKPHVAELDTVLSGDTISAAYFFPRQGNEPASRPPARFTENNRNPENE